MSPLPGALWPDRRLGPERYTACGWLVRDGRVLLERRPDDAVVAPACWDVPGGHVERGEGASGTLVRELREELGIIVTRCRPPVALDELESQSGRRYRHYHFFVDEWRGAVASREGRILRWFGLGALGELDALQPLVPEALTALRARGWLGPEERGG